MQRVLWDVRHGKEAAYDPATQDRVKGDANGFVFCGAYGLALLGVNRATEVRVSEPAPKLLKARARRGKEPIVTVSRVKIHLGKPTVRYARSEIDAAIRGDAPTRHQAWHMRSAHLRTYRNKRDGTPREKPLVIRVEAYAAGDPALGVVVRERRIGR